jgi:hypothetical protein
MMYRPTVAVKAVREFARQAVAAGTNALAFANDAVFGKLIAAGIYDQAMRENRQFNRVQKRGNKHHNYMGYGLNGPRAMERRRRQIAAGSLRVENGLVAL